MRSIHDLTKATVDESREAPAYEAVVARDVPNTTTGVHVTVPTYDSVHRWGPLRWMPRVDDSGDVVLPQKGDEALIVETFNGEPWMTGYWRP